MMLVATLVLVCVTLVLCVYVEVSMRCNARRSRRCSASWPRGEWPRRHNTTRGRSHDHRPAVEPRRADVPRCAQEIAGVAFKPLVIDKVPVGLERAHKAKVA